MPWPRFSRALVLSGLGALAGCPGPEDGAWFRFGHLGPEHFPDGVPVDPLPWQPLGQGDTVDLILGGQGLVMLALPLQAGELAIDPALEPNDPGWPELEATIDVDGHNDGVGGHFWRIANYPVWFDESDDPDAQWEFFFLTVIIPDSIGDASELEGLPARLEATLEPADEEPIALGVDFVLGTAPE